MNRKITRLIQPKLQLYFAALVVFAVVSAFFNIHFHSRENPESALRTEAVPILAVPFPYVSVHFFKSPCIKMFRQTNGIKTSFFSFLKHPVRIDF